MPHLVIPIQVDALFLAEGITCIGQDINFDQLPYFDLKAKVDVNGDRPYAAEAIIAPPFQNDNLRLRRGMHLHWALPDFLTTSKHGGETNEFPAVPNRWYIRKEENEEIIGEWVVESDYLWSDEPNCPVPELCVTALPVEEGKPYTYMGRCYTLEEWRKHDSKPKSYWYHTYKEPLTSLGWGTLAFDTFYPNCRSVFGFYDKDATKIVEEDKLTYTVIGWTEYLHEQKDQNDYVQTLIKKFKDGIIDFDTLSDVINFEIPKDPSILSDGLLCYGSICIENYLSANIEASSIRLSVGTTYSEAISALLSQLHVKNDESALQRKIAEEQFESAILENEMNELKLDVRARLRELRHEKGFNGLETGRQWSVGVAKSSKMEQAKTDGDALILKKNHPSLEKLKVRQQREKTALLERQTNELKIFDNIQEDPEFEAQKERMLNNHLEAIGKLEEEHQKSMKNLIDDIRGEELSKWTAELYRELDKLKEAQWKYNLLSNELESQTSALYYDWARYIFCSYPPEGEIEEFPSQDKALRFIQSQSIPNVTNLRERLGAYPLGEASSFGRRKPKPNTLEHEIITSYKRLKKNIEVINSLEAPDKALEINEVAGTIYWEPLVPAIVLTSKKEAGKGVSLLAPSNRFGTSRRGEQTKAPTCMVTSSRIALGNSGEFEASTLIDEVKSFKLQQYVQNKEVDKPFGENSLPANAWHPYRVDWEAAVYPLASGNAATKQSGNYSKKFILQNYELNEGDSDLSKNSSIDSAHALLKTPNKFQGSGFIASRVRREYKSKLQKYMAQLPEEDSSIKELFKKGCETLESCDFMAFSLGGFNQILLQQSPMPTLKPNDPLGFRSYKEFAKKVNDALKGEGGGATDVNLSPSPLTAYTPIRNGALKLSRVRLVDTFGRVKDIKPQVIYTSAYNTINGQNSWVMLKPRLAQPANMSIRWKDQGQTSKGVASSGGIVCGWMIPNILDQNLMFFNAQGRHVGNINPRGEWERDVFWLNTEIHDTNGGKNQGQEHGSKVMEQVIEWLKKEQSNNKGFLTDFIKCITETTDNIFPESKDSGSVVSVLAGRPMAIAQANVNLYLKGNPAFDLSWNEFRQDMEKGGRETDGFTKVRFPFRIGDFKQTNDNLIGYWANDYTGDLGDTFWLNDTELASLNPNNISGEVPTLLQREKGLRLDPKNKILPLKDFLEKMVDNGFIAKKTIMDAYFEDGADIWDLLVESRWLDLMPIKESIRYAAKSDLSFSLEDAPQMFTMLLNPTGATHLVSGIVPVQEISLPSSIYQEALKNIEITFFTAPVLKPHTGLSMSLPNEKHYTWSWLQAERANGGFRFQRTIHKPNIRKSKFVDAFMKYEVLKEEALKAKGEWDESKQPTDIEETRNKAIEIAWRLLSFLRWITREEKYEEEYGIINYEELEKATQEFEVKRNEILLSNLPDTQEKIASLENDRTFLLLIAFLAVLPEIVEGIRPFSARPQHLSSTEIVEGWLSLKSS